MQKICTYLKKKYIFIFNLQRAELVGRRLIVRIVTVKTITVFYRHYKMLRCTGWFLKPRVGAIFRYHFEQKTLGGRRATIHWVYTVLDKFPNVSIYFEQFLC